MTALRRLSAFLPVLVFVFLALQAAHLKSPPSRFACADGAAAATAADELQRYMQDRTAGRPNLRVVPRAVMAAFESAASGLLSLGFVAPEESRLYQGFSGKGPYKIDAVDTRCVAAETALLMFVLVVLSPILLLSYLWLRRTLSRALFVAACMFVVIGWHPDVISLVILGGGIFADWPHSYYLFDQHAHAENFWALGVVMLFYLALANAGRLRPVHFVALAVLGQLSLEYFGPLLVGAGLLVLVMLPGDGDRPTARRHGTALTMAAALGTLAAAALAAGVFYLLGGSVKVILATPENPHQHIDNNIAWMNVVIANLVMMNLPALIAGLLVGLVDGLLPGPGVDRSRAARDMVVLSAMILGFVGIFLVGIFTASYPSEMGRQFLPMALLSGFLGTRSGAWLVAVAMARGKA